MPATAGLPVLELDEDELLEELELEDDHLPEDELEDELELEEELELEDELEEELGAAPQAVKPSASNTTPP
jgi:hypothetical protein